MKKELIVKISKQYVFMLAIIIVYLDKNSHLYEQFDYIKMPPISYVENIKKLINIDKYYDRFTNINALYEDAIKHNLFKSYQNPKHY